MFRKSKLSFLVVATMFSAAIFLSSCGEKAVPDTMSYNDVEIKPQFKNKDVTEFRVWINEQINRKYGGYPSLAKDNNIQGTVRVAFMIDTDGSLSDVKIVGKVDPTLDDAVLEIVKESPKWKPGSHKGKKVKIPLQIPIVFKMLN
jgi:protein TonB